jgi:hypothetical protein
MSRKANEGESRRVGEGERVLHSFNPPVSLSLPLPLTVPSRGVIE